MTETARGVALAAVRRVIEEGGYSNLALSELLGRSTLSARDRAFVSELTYGTLRRLPAIDRALGLRATRPVERMSPLALGALRLGAYQLLFAGVAAHAAVSESVDLVGARERGFVNAVLRRIAADPPAAPAGHSDAEMSLRIGLARWAIAELRRIVGDDVEVAAAALAEQAPLCIRANPCATTVEELERALQRAGHRPVRSTLSSDCLLLERGDPSSLPGYGRGWFAVQDQASAFVVRTLDARRGELVLDACAGPGGKAAAIACIVGPEGAVIAGDLHPHRSALVRSGAARLGQRPLVFAHDATRPAVRGPFDRVLVDAPCSGIGAARRRPELLWRPRREDLSQLARLQVEIAAASADLLRYGGRLVYAVCTFPRAETDAACDAILRHRPDLRPTPTEGPDGRAERHRLWPHRHGSDGMFVAAFERTG